jgi:sugar lactone lactonase YvrE
MRHKIFFLPVLLVWSICSHAQIITTIAGTGTAAYSGDGGLASAASLNEPTGIFVNKAGDIVFSDENNIRIRKIDTSGIITTIAGTGSGGYSADGVAATSAEVGRIAASYCVAQDAQGNILFSDNDYAYLRFIDTAGLLRTLAGNGTIGYAGDGGPATVAEISGADGIAFDGMGNIYFSDMGNNCIRKINKATGVITTVAGNGTAGYTGDGVAATATELYWPDGIAINSAGDIYIADVENSRVRKVDTSGIITTVAGTGSFGLGTGDEGPATAATFYFIANIALDSIGNLYIADDGTYSVRKVDRYGIIHTYAGSGATTHSGDGGPATAAGINSPEAIVFDSHGNAYISETIDNYIRKVTTDDSIPSFVNGRNQALASCVADTTFIDSLLPVTDPDVGQTETWTLTYGPLHGTASVAYSTVSTGSALTPSGLWYTSAAGYSGADTFSVRIDDGYSVYTTTVYVTVRLCPLLTAAVDDKQEALVFPDPSDGSFSIRPFSNTATSITITSMVGQKVYCTTIDRTTDIRPGLPAGLYIIDASGADGQHSVMKLSIR